MRAWDRSGVEAVSEPVTIIVDNTPPYVEVTTSFGLFSPDSDGRLDTLTINQRSSTAEDAWKGEIRSAEGIIRSYAWQDTLADFVWDGKDESGKVVRDGEYSYTVSSIDRAGNYGEYLLRGITVDTSAKQARLDIGSAAFSPNSDGVRDSLTFYPKALNTANLDTWRILIVDERGNRARAYQGNGVPPADVAFDGRSDDAGSLPDGLYRGILSLRYKNGTELETGSTVFAIDTYAPVAVVNINVSVFSPDGDGTNDTAYIAASATDPSAIGSCGIQIVDPAGNLFRHFSGSGPPSRQIE